MCWRSTSVGSLGSTVRSVARRLFNAFGVDVRLLRNLRAAAERARTERELDAWRMLASRKFATILDIGANEGQFLRVARTVWPDAHIHSFEPLPEVFEKLERTAQEVGSCSVHPIGLSDRTERREMFHSAFSPSSSLLPMTELHRSEWPESAQSKQVSIRLARLDDWVADQRSSLRGPTLVKIDVQGFESAVIDGGRQWLRTVDMIVIEATFYPLYDGQALFGTIHQMLADLGFVYRGNVEQFASKDGRRVLYADAIFENCQPEARFGP